MTSAHIQTPNDQAQQLWLDLVNARIGATPLICALTEDAVFGFYLPMARSMARQAHGDSGPDGTTTQADQAAELGLAEAVLAWRQPDSTGFERYARAAITARLRRYHR